MIKIISQTTKEREEETIELFNEIKPLLDKGYSYSLAVRTVKNIPTIYVSNYKWFKEVVKYGETQGYRYGDYQNTHI